MALDDISDWYNNNSLLTDGWFYSLLLLALSFLVILRSVSYRAVFRDGFVVYPGNDPYHYRFWVDHLVASDVAFTDLGTIGRIVSGDVMTYVTGWWVTAMLESGQSPSGVILAWLPVIAALCVGVLVAWMAIVAFEDRRVAVLAVLLLAITPGNVQYSFLGYFDHHAFDYVWLALMAASLLWMARGHETTPTGWRYLATPQTWLAAGCFGVATALSMMNWKGAPLLLLGVAAFGTLLALSAIRSTRSPLLVSVPLLTGLVSATVITHGLHTAHSWGKPEAVYAPAIVLAGLLTIALLAEAFAKVYPDLRLATATTLIASLLGTGAFASLAPDLWRTYAHRFQDDLLGRPDIAEAQGLVDPGFFLGFGPVEQFGLVLFFALPALAFVSWRCRSRHEPRWLVLVGFGWAMLALLCLQVRFSGEFAVFGSIFGAIGIIQLLSWLKYASPVATLSDATESSDRQDSPVADHERAVYVGLVVAIIVIVGVVYSVGIVGSLTITDEEYDAAAWLSENSEGEESYVLSRWGRNRLYNHFAWDGGASYSYSLQHFDDFLGDTDPDSWYGEFRNRGVAYIVIPELDQSISRPDITYSQLFFEYGSATDRTGSAVRRTDGLGRYRLVYRTPGGTNAIFEPVPGAKVAGSAQPDSEVTLETDVTVGDTRFTYTRRTQSNESGIYTVRVAYSGTYSLSTGGEIVVTAEDVTEGSVLAVPAEPSSTDSC